MTVSRSSSSSGGLPLTLALLSPACTTWVTAGTSYTQVQTVDVEEGVIAGDEETIRITEIVAAEKRVPDQTMGILLAIVLGAAVLSAVDAGLGDTGPT